DSHCRAHDSGASPQVRCVPRAVGQRASELRLRLPQVHGSRLRPGPGPQGLQIARLRRAVHRASRQGHHRTQVVGVPAGQGPRG
ncbi:hypothetical protein N7274_15565, partial [Enterococcus faecalis]|nr:hypothetical protein [Enterococcus faecalis]